jgi:hypothetical protein
MRVTVIACLVVGALVGCGVTPDDGDRETLPASQACGQQAYMFCNASNLPWTTDTCRTGYLQDCMPKNQGIAVDSHIACLEAITQSEGSRCVPLVCTATWGDPDRVAHFCRI